MENSSPPHVRAPGLLGAMSPSSPRSDSVSKALDRHRKALEEIRNSNLDEVPALNLHSRVVFQSADIHDQVEERASRSDSYPVLWKNLVTWKNPAGSCFALVAGSFVYAFLRSGSTTTMACYVLLSRIGWHVLGAMFSSRGVSRSQLVGSALVDSWSATVRGIDSLFSLPI